MVDVELLHMKTFWSIWFKKVKTINLQSVPYKRSDPILFTSHTSPIFYYRSRSSSFLIRNINYNVAGTEITGQVSPY